MPKRYIVRLSPEERQELQSLVSIGKAAAYKIKHANLLLNIDVNGQGWTDEEASSAIATPLPTCDRDWLNREWRLLWNASPAKHTPAPESVMERQKQN